MLIIDAILDRIEVVPDAHGNVRSLVLHLMSTDTSTNSRLHDKLTIDNPSDYPGLAEFLEVGMDVVGSESGNLTIVTIGSIMGLSRDIYTLNFIIDDDCSLELVGDEVKTNHNETLQIARRKNIKTIDGYTLYPDGCTPYQNKDLEEMLAIVDDVIGSNISLDDDVVSVVYWHKLGNPSVHLQRCFIVIDSYVFLTLWDNDKQAFLNPDREPIIREIIRYWAYYLTAPKQ